MQRCLKVAIVVLLGGVRCAMGQTLTVSGNVWAPGGITATNAMVRLRRSPPPDPSTFSITTMAVHKVTAEYRFSGLEPRAYELVAFESPYMAACEDIRLPGDFRKDLRLERGVPQPFPRMQIDGYKKREKARPLAGARVRVAPRCRDWVNPQVTYGSVDTDGNTTGPDLLGPEDKNPTSFVILGIELLEPSGVTGPRQAKGDGPLASDEGITSEPQDTKSEPTGTSKDVAKPVDVFIGKRPDIPLLVGTDRIAPTALHVDLDTGTISVDYGLRVRDKLVLHLHRFYSTAALFLPAVVATINQKRNTPEEWGQGTKGFTRRYGSSYLYSFAVRNTMSFALDSVFHQDPRYFPSTHDRLRRLRDSALQTVTTRTDRGRTTINVWRIGSAYGAGLLSRNWYPDDSAGTGDALVRASVSLCLDTAANIIREFTPDLKARMRRTLGKK